MLHNVTLLVDMFLNDVPHIQNEYIYRVPQMDLNVPSPFFHLLIAWCMGPSIHVHINACCARNRQEVPADGAASISACCRIFSHSNSVSNSSPRVNLSQVITVLVISIDIFSRHEPLKSRTLCTVRKFN